MCSMYVRTVRMISTDPTPHAYLVPGMAVWRATQPNSHSHLPMFANNDRLAILGWRGAQ